jgi:hypothetical protein
MCNELTKLSYVTIEQALTDISSDTTRLEPLNLNLCRQYERHRTTQVTAYNKTPYVFAAILVQLKSEFPLAPGYVSDTGVCVMATNVNPGAFASVDPCACGGSAKPIQADWAQFGAIIRRPRPGGGFEEVAMRPLPPKRADPGTAFRTVTVELHLSPPADAPSDDLILSSKDVEALFQIGG